ncbi:MAG TPA: OB-fold domain-containing protein [Streptosporangiaceae bacterium]|nr:OB-fold domain-containing protein [Streptosporangiaceae bacterium]
MTAIEEAAAKVMAAGECAPRLARDPVNLPMVHNWVEAVGDANPVYTDAESAARSIHGGLVAPPAMAQVWTMPGLHPNRGKDDPLGLMSAALDEAGFTSVVATNCEQVYHRYLHHGERVSVTSSLAEVTGPKRTALGEGWFVTTRSTWYAGDEPVATMLFRILKFRPSQAPPPVPAPAPGSAVPDVLRPAVSQDTRFFWEGTAAGELRIQRCGQCGTLRHPPGPLCLGCGDARPGYQVAAGTGEVYSYVVHHHPPIPGKRLPIVVALVTLTEGVRMVAELVGVDPGQVRIGMPVRVGFHRVDDGLTLPVWRAEHEDGQRLPELVVDVTPTFVVASAIATRDFQDVHHDKAKAMERGGRDIFVNILTTAGLVQRYVTDWAGPQAVVRRLAIRLGVPCYAGDTLTLSGRVSEGSGDEGDHVVEVTGRCSLGDHVTGTVLLSGVGTP